MSLIEESMESFRVLDRRTVSDGYGGFIPQYINGAEFQAAIALDSSIEARVAEKQGVTALYTVYTTKAVNLQYHDIFQRLSDEKVFRVTSDGDDSATPKSAGLDLRTVSAEEYTFPRGS